eukprot:Phypoly_transcript_11896.p1 GENE.Phypoly_transcript_11896~~Phypoly_transcript_11896.p1  ORF type:complete len:264 (+),score=19.51 Phypoly_transcript_11896:39-794(+)
MGARNVSVEEFLMPLDRDDFQSLFPKLKYVTVQDILDVPRREFALSWDPAEAPIVHKIHELICSQFLPQLQENKDFDFDGSKICFHAKLGNPNVVDRAEGCLSVTQCDIELLARRPQIECVNFSNSFIHPADMVPIVKTLLLLPNLKYVDFSFCQLEHTAMFSLNWLVTRKNVEYINVTGNPMISMDWEFSIRVMPKEQFLKFIWIPKKWINDNKWQRIVSQRSDSAHILREVVATTKLFYENKEFECSHL